MTNESENQFLPKYLRKPLKSIFGAFSTAGNHIGNAVGLNPKDDKSGKSLVDRTLDDISDALNLEDIEKNK